MDKSDKAIRDHLVRLLDWEEAHVNFDRAVDGLTPAERGARAAGFEHSPWQIVEHIRIAQEDILDFCVNPAYEHTRKWPDDYWPNGPSPSSEAAWTNSVGSVARTRDELKRLAHDVEDLTARVPTGKGQQTYLRAILLTADHAAYHVGQLIAVRKAVGAWPKL